MVGERVGDETVTFFFFKQKTAYEILIGLVGSEMCIRDRTTGVSGDPAVKERGARRDASEGGA